VVAEVVVFPAAEVPVTLPAGADALWELAVEVVVLLLPQPAAMATASSALTATTTRLHCPRVGQLIGNLPRGELIGSTGW
jgi:hypothetical protein